MKRLLLILILTLSFQSIAKADDIKDLEIEGMSIGDSLLDFMSKEKIEKLKMTDYPNSKKFSRVTTIFPNMEIYEDVMIQFKTNDKKYIIYAVDGGLYYENNIKSCYKKKDEIVKNISKQFPNLKTKKKSTTHSYDNESWTDSFYFYFKNGGLIEITCLDWTKKVTNELNWVDNLAVRLMTEEFRTWLNTEAFD
tara:strand:- start:2207 stop:2788 length:582 start_codon:yes stop_codon:yes gene_type:complete